MHVSRMKALVQAIREVNEIEWARYRRLPVVKHGVPNPLLMTYAASKHQDAYTCIYTDKHAVVNRTDGDSKWRLASHFGVADELVGRIFGTGGCGGAVTPKACADYILGLIDAHEQALGDLMLRGQQFAQDVLRNIVVAKKVPPTTLDLDEEDFGFLPPPTQDYSDDFSDSLPQADEWNDGYDAVDPAGNPEHLDTREESDITPTAQLTLKKK